MTLMNYLIDQPRPKRLDQWAWQAMIASYSAVDCPELWGDILQYLGWLDSLPVKGHNG